MKPRHVLCGAIALLAAVGIAGRAKDDGPPGPEFEHAGYTLEIRELEAQTELELTPGGESEYTIALECLLSIPPGQDDKVIAVTEELHAAAVEDTRGDDILDRKKGKTRRKGYKSGTFEYMHKPSREIELDETELLRDAYRVHRMRLEAQVLLAREWEYVRVPAAVTTKEQEGPSGIRFRVAELGVDEKGHWDVEIACKRPEAGPTGPFVGRVAALDSLGRELVDGKLQKGDPLAEESALIGEFTVPLDAELKYVRVGIVTEYEVKTLRFEVTDIVPD